MKAITETPTERRRQPIICRILAGYADKRERFEQACTDLLSRLEDHKRVNGSRKPNGR